MIIRQRLENGQNLLDFTIPRGDKGDKGDKGDQGERGFKGNDGAIWQPYINETDGHWHVKKLAGEPGMAGEDLQKLKDYIDDQILNGKW